MNNYLFQFSALKDVSTRNNSELPLIQWRHGHQSWFLFFGALDSGLASRGKSVMREIMNTNLTKKTGTNVQPISLLQGFLRNFLLYGTCLVYKI